MSRVNLNALIKRESFEINQKNPQKPNETNSVKLIELEKSSLWRTMLRKPDFQRYTNEWTPQKVCNFIQSFIDRDFIPALVLWQNPDSGHIFVIDGSHRLSALIAWLEDDYGDGESSKLFFKKSPSKAQVALAVKTRELVNFAVGSWEEYRQETQNPGAVQNPKVLKNLQFLHSCALPLQWEHGDASKAERSFFKINCEASPINKTEIQLIKWRRKATGLAARAIDAKGGGYQYWSGFSASTQSRIERLASSLNQILFEPDFESKFRTMDIPIGGQSYGSTTVPLILEFVREVNSGAIEQNIKENPANKGRKKGEREPSDDTTGSETLAYLGNCLKMAQAICSPETNSLGLHPAVYFYSDGKYKVATFYGAVALIKYLQDKDRMDDFTEQRAKLESFIVNNEYLVQQIVRARRQAKNATLRIRDFFIFLIDKFGEGKTEQQIIKLFAKSDFKFLVTSKRASQEYERKISKSTKSFVYRRDVLPTIPKCDICGGYLHGNSISFDHKKRKRVGGTGNPVNVKMAHFYCNNTYKN